MMFSIPSDLTQFSVAGLEDLRSVALTELRTRRDAVTDPTKLSDEEMAELAALKQFTLDAKAQISALEAKVAEFAALGDEPEPVEAPVETPVEAPAAVEPVEVITAAATTAPVTMTQVAAVAPTVEVPAPQVPEGLAEYHSLVASADVPGFSTGTELRTWRDFATAFTNRTRSYSGKAPLRHPVAEIRRDFPSEFVLTESMNDATMDAIMQHARDESRLEGGSLVAANGWCAPSETLYSTCLQVTTDGLLSVPEVVARRGGIRHNQGIEFDAIFGTGTGFSELTEAQVIADVLKTCLDIPCPPFVDDRLKITALCLTGSILQNRAYPEFVETFVRGAIATYAHFQNREIIADIVAGSVAVPNLSAVDPWATDASVVSQVLGAVEMAITDIRYRLRLSQTQTIEIVFPFWLKALFRQDFSRRTGFDGVGLVDSQIDAWMSMRGARAQYVYDWQDAFSGVATGPGADTPISTLPALVTPAPLSFLAYPAGTWVLARQDVIRLESIYDSVNLPQNRVTQLFMEDGWAAMRMCPLSRLYTINICPSGATSALRTVACADVTL
jgi:hypothetical protein